MIVPPGTAPLDTAAGMPGPASASAASASAASTHRTRPDATSECASASAAFADWPGDAPWQRLPDAARRSFRLAALLVAGVLCSAVFGLPLFISLIDQESGLPLRLLWTLLPAALIFGFALWRASVAYRNVRWRLDEDGLRVRRGRIWRSEVLVPRARVQHLDIERGPIERRYGLATLIVHTAGTRMNALRQPGFDEDTAARLRDALVPKIREVDLPAVAALPTAVPVSVPGLSARAPVAAAVPAPASDAAADAATAAAEQPAPDPSTAVDRHAD